MRVALVGCSAQKLGHTARARYLYQGNLFKLSVKWIEERSHVYSQWGILSAKHGLVLPDQEIVPYDWTLRSMDRQAEKAWGKMVCQQLTNEWGAGTIYTVLAGASYRAGLYDMPYVEDVFGHWIRWRREVEKKRGRVGIGYLMQQLKNNRGRS
jgi:hypothetical protein